MLKLCASDNIQEGESKGFDVNGRQIFVVRFSGSLFAYENACPHLGIPLEWKQDSFLDSDGQLIQCSTHGALFTIEEGLCVSGPCSGQSLKKRKLQEQAEFLYLVD